jgi:hypothetical protein
MLRKQLSSAQLGGRVKAVVLAVEPEVEMGPNDVTVMEPTVDVAEEVDESDAARGVDRSDVSALLVSSDKVDEFEVSESLVGSDEDVDVVEVSLDVGTGAVKSADTVDVCSMRELHSLPAIAPSTSSAHVGSAGSSNATITLPPQSKKRAKP